MKFCLSVFFVLVFTTSCFSSSDKKKEKAEALMRRAADLSELDGSDLTKPFHLYLRLKLGGLKAGPSQGRFLWISASQDTWRRELTFSGYSEIEIGKAGTIWRKRSLDFTPQSASWIHSLLSQYDQLTFLDGERVDGFYRESDLQCVQLRRDNDARDVCFGPSGTLSVVFYPQENTSYEYFDYRNFRKKLFPHSLKVFAHGRLVVEATVEELDVEQPLRDGYFEPPPGTEKMPGCLNPVPGRLVSAVEPRYTYLARSQHRYGSVYLSIYIGRDGSISNVRVLGTAGPDLDDAAVTAVSRWKYTPFLCAGQAVPVEKGITINFPWAHDSLTNEQILIYRRGYR